MRQIDQLGDVSELSKPATEQSNKSIGRYRHVYGVERSFAQLLRVFFFGLLAGLFAGLFAGAFAGSLAGPLTTSSPAA